MSSKRHLPDYELAERIDISSPGELRAIADPLRVTLLDLVLERAATVKELAAAVGRPKSTVAYHVNVLVDAGMFQVVRTLRVRAIDERYYGRTARVFFIGVVNLPGAPMWANAVLRWRPLSPGPPTRPTSCAASSATCGLPMSGLGKFWDRVVEVAREFTQLSRSGDTVYGFVAALYPTDHPTLPEPSDAG